MGGPPFPAAVAELGESCRCCGAGRLQLLRGWGSPAAVAELGEACRCCGARGRAPPFRRRAEALAKALWNISTPAVALRFRIFGLRPRPGRREERSERRSCAATALRLTPAEGANGSRLSGFACGRDDGLRKRRGLAPSAASLFLCGHPIRSRHSALCVTSHSAVTPDEHRESRGLLASRAVARSRRANSTHRVSSRFRQSRRPGSSNPERFGSDLGIAARAPNRGAAAVANPSAPADTGYLLVAGMTAESVAATCSSPTHRSRCSSSRASEARPRTGGPRAWRRRSGTSQLPPCDEAHPVIPVSAEPKTGIQ